MLYDVGDTLICRSTPKGRRKCARLMTGGVVRSLDEVLFLVIGVNEPSSPIELRISSNSFANDGDFSGSPTHRQTRELAG